MIVLILIIYMNRIVKGKKHLTLPQLTMTVEAFFNFRFYKLERS